jgi:hypothetical protein
VKNDKQCPKCKSLDIGFIEHQPDLRADSKTAYKRVAGLAPVLEGSASVIRKVGTLEAYVCMECGFYETYVRDPRTVEWESIAGFRRVNPDVAPDGPFR